MGSWFLATCASIDIMAAPGSEQTAPMPGSCDMLRSMQDHLGCYMTQETLLLRV